MLHLSRHHGLIPSLIIASTAALATIAIAGLQTEPQDGTASTAASPLLLGDDERWLVLAREAQELRTNLAADMTPDEIDEALRELRAKTDIYLEDHPDDYRAWNLIVNLSGQLQDDEGVDDAVANLRRIQPDNIQVGLMWVVHYSQTNATKSLAICDLLLEEKPTSLMYHNAWIVTQRTVDPAGVPARFKTLADNPETLDQAIAFGRAVQQSDAWEAVPMGLRLAELAPDNPAAVEVAGRAYRFSNQFDKGREILSTLSDEQLATPQLAYLYSDCHYADHHFDEAYEIMSAIDLDAIENEGLANRLRFMLPLRAQARTAWAEEQAIQTEQAKTENLPRVRLTINGEPVEVELFAKEAPNTVAAFLALARRGDFDNTPFGQVQTGFRSIGGTIPGRVPYTLPGEFKREDARDFFSGTLAMYLPRAGDPDSAHCEWCIYHFPAPHLNGERTVFGRVVSGLEDVRAMREGQSTLDRVEIIRDADPELAGYNPDPNVIDTAGRTRPFSEVMAESDARAANTNGTPTSP